MALMIEAICLETARALEPKGIRSSIARD